MYVFEVVMFLVISYRNLQACICLAFQLCEGMQFTSSFDCVCGMLLLKLLFPCSSISDKFKL